MNYLEVSISIEPLMPWRDLLNADLGELNYESFVDTAQGTQAFVDENYYEESKLVQLLEEYKKDCKTSYIVKKIESTNWNEEWEKNFTPIIVNEKCIIRATFHSPEKKYPYDIIINPKMSFGTGHHATTYLMIEQLLALNVKRGKVLDMGCGTSVLSILASKLQAKEIVAIDFDEWSVNNSIENIALNNISNVSVKQGSAELIENHQFNLILANINLNVLLAQIETYYNALLSGGIILFSGVLEQDLDTLLIAIKKIDLVVKTTKQRDKWVMVYCIKL